MAGKFDTRLHLLCRPEDLDTVRAALGKSLPGWLSFAPVSDEPDSPPRLYIDSGQWTTAQAAQLTAACAGLPVRVVRGVALGLVEQGAVVAGKGDPSPRTEATARRTVERSIEEWEQELGVSVQESPRKPH